MCFTLILCVFLSTNVVSFADDIDYTNNTTKNSIIKSAAYWEEWRITNTVKNYTTKEMGSWVLCYKGQPATRDNETQTATASLTVSATVTGSLGLTKKQIAASIGVSLSGGYTIGGYTTSAPLKKGEYIKGYARPVYSVSKVTQQKYIHDGNVIKTGETRTAYVNKPTACTVKIEYYRNTYSSKSLTTNIPYKTEYYKVDTRTGKSTLLKTTENFIE